MNVFLLGKGDFVIKVVEWFKKNNNLVLMVPDQPKPKWISSLTKWRIKNNVDVIESGRHFYIKKFI